LSVTVDRSAVLGHGFVCDRTGEELHGPRTGVEVEIAAKADPLAGHLLVIFRDRVEHALLLPDDADQAPGMRSMNDHR
jgi:hypothetical protein